MKYLELAEGSFTEEHYEKSLEENFPYVGYSVEENKVLYSEIIKDYVDLGLPSGTMWARCNVNAADPYDFGDQFYFGSIDSGSTEYNVPYIGCIDFYPDNFKPDGEFLIEQYYDAAYFHSNGKFRIPTANDFRELLENTYSIFHFENDNGEVLEFEAYWNPNNGNNGADSLGHQLPEEVRNIYTHKLTYVKVISLNNKRHIIFPVGNEFSYQVYHTSTTQQSGYCWSLSADDRGLLIVNGGPGSGRVFRNVRGILVKRNKIDSSSYNKIDLGLRTDDGKIIYFADRNLGANSPEEVGNYYQWGTTEGAPVRYNYITDPINTPYLQWGLNYKHYNYIYSSSFWNTNATEWEMTKYNEDAELVLENKDDAAHIKLGGKWQIPGYDALDPLMNSDLFDYEYVNSNADTGEFDGVRVISKIPGFEGNSIYLPSTGFVDASSRYGDTVDDIKNIGLYWSKTIYYGDVDVVELGSDYLTWSSSDTINGLPIRPVWIE